MNYFQLKTSGTKEDIIIYTKNSLYGTVKLEKEDDHLYVKNILNLRKGNRNIKIQKDFERLFDLINKDIPFFKDLVSKSEFLSYLK